MQYVQSFIRIFAFFISHISLYPFTYTYTYVIFYTCYIHMLIYVPYISFTQAYTILYFLIISWFISGHLHFSSCSYQHVLVTIYISSHITNFIYIFVLISNLYLFRSPVRVTELIPIRRYLYTYLYLYQSYTCSTELILVL